MQGAALITALVILGLSANVLANPDSIVPGGQDPDTADPEFTQKSVDVYTEVEYTYELDSSRLVRERVGDPNANPLSGVPTVRDLKFNQFSHTLTPRISVGVFHDTFVYAALPIVIQQVRELSLDTGVDRAGPRRYRRLLAADGFDARDPGTPTPDNLMFRGPTRHGLDQVHVGLGFALMNQAKDDTKPTWKMGAEARLAIGEVMKFDPMAPNANKGVSSGVQELKVWTTFARKLDWAEPWVELWWMTPIAAKSDSLFTDPGFGATNTSLSQQAGVSAGLELYALDNKADNTRISLDIGSKVVGHFEGREYTEMWEVFAFAGDSRGPGPLTLEGDPSDGAASPDPLSHPGISNIENYLDMTARFALRAQIGPHVRFAVAGDLVWKTDHLISFADAGVDGNDDNDLVNPNTDEVNPLHTDRSTSSAIATSLRTVSTSRLACPEQYCSDASIRSDAAHPPLTLVEFRSVAAWATMHSGARSTDYCAVVGQGVRQADGDVTQGGRWRGRSSPKAQRSREGRSQLQHSW